jgi:hypothetical protein
LEHVITLNGHKNWVRDVAWNNDLLKDYDIIASSSEVIITNIKTD